MSKRNRGNHQDFEASSAIFWTGLLLTSEPSAPTTVMACSLTRSSQPHIYFSVVPTHLCIDGEAVSHRGGAHVGRVETDKAARSIGGSHSLRTQASTMTGADRRWP